MTFETAVPPAPASAFPRAGAMEKLPPCAKALSSWTLWYVSKASYSWSVYMMWNSWPGLLGRYSRSKSLCASTLELTGHDLNIEMLPQASDDVCRHQKRNRGSKKLVDNNKIFFKTPAFLPLVLTTTTLFMPCEPYQLWRNRANKADSQVMVLS